VIITTMSTECVDGNYSEIPENSASNVRVCSRLSHGYHGHFLGLEAMFASARRDPLAALFAFLYLAFVMLFLVMEVVFPQP